MSSPEIAFMTPNLKAASHVELFELHGQVMRELRERGLVRTANAPAGDYAEYLVCQALDGVLAPASEKSFDLTCARFGKVQVKARVVSDKILSGQRQTSAFRSSGFDHAALVMLSDQDFSVRHAVIVPRSMVEDRWSWRKHVNGYVLHLRPELLEHPEAIDLTELLRETANSRTD